MQANVAEILTAAAAVEGITKATAREFRETDEYPLFYCGGRSLPAGNNEPANTKTDRYNQTLEYVNHIYVEANTEDDADVDYSDYELAESLGDAFLASLLADAAWELVSSEQYPARIGDTTVIINEIVVSKFRIKKYGI